MTNPEKSYSQILKASSIMGGAAGINMILGMVRVKFAAVLIGTTGIGLLASFTAVQGFIGIIAGMGIQSSAVGNPARVVGWLNMDGTKMQQDGDTVVDSDGSIWRVINSSLVSES